MLYKYNVNGEYTGTKEPQIDPLESKKQKKTIYCKYTYVTNIEPPECQENEVTVFENKDWTIKKDYRGVVYKKDTAEQSKLEELGDVPETFTTIKPDCDFPKWNKDKWEVDTAKELAAYKENEIQKIKSNYLQNLIDNDSEIQAQIETINNLTSIE